MGINKVNPVLKIVLDTNFLMTPFNLEIDVISELDRIINQKYEIIIPLGIIKELKGLLKNPNLKTRTAAKLALKIAKRYKIVDIKDENGDIDDLIVQFSKKEYCAVATNDQNLRRRLKSEGIPTIYVRQKSHLEVEGYL
ncbi:MAG: type II toxin-antitoxin system VapC family toxin [Candidatus Jordarchaeum sp.]|uniref:type II toxin-antitoxin system VapC family toxin n=1 Tax=Candidatus Jordarchaeum sp. TaxID=2823881 RepID=UPI0040491F13